MAFLLSPGVLVQEVDLTTIVPAVATSIGAMVGQFAWGPVEEIVVIDTENNLRVNFGDPNDDNFRDWFSAANFLSYARNLKTVRVVGSNALNASVVLNSNATLVGGSGKLIKNLQSYDNAVFSNEVFIAKWPGTYGNNLGIAWADTAVFTATDSDGLHTWDFWSEFSATPATNEFNIVIYDATGNITGTAGTVLEKFPLVSSVPGTKRSDGTSAYIPDVLNNESDWVWICDLAQFLLAADDLDGVTFAGGANGATPTDGNRQAGYALFQDAEAVDVNLVLQAGGSAVVGKWIIDNIGEVRRDCVVFVSPEESDVVNVASNDTILDNIQTTRTSYGSSSYAVMDGNWKYQYDRYNDKYRWVPLNGDIAGLCARTDFTNDPWWSPAGLNRGNVKNVIKLAWNPSNTFRDELYSSGVNPVVSFKDQGPVLFGDKTLLTRPSAFDRINVRRLFIVLEKAIATAAKFLLFEFNDEFTRAQFVNMVDPFLRDVQGRRGVIAYKVVADESNNTGEVIDRNEFVGDIYIKPSRSINFIRLNFIAVRTAVSFEEVGG